MKKKKKNSFCLLSFCITLSFFFQVAESSVCLILSLKKYVLLTGYWLDNQISLVLADCRFIILEHFECQIWTSSLVYLSTYMVLELKVEKKSI